MKQFRKSMVFVLMLVVILGTNYKLVSEDELKAVNPSMDMLTEIPFVTINLSYFSFLSLHKL